MPSRPRSRPVVGVLWSAVATMELTRQGVPGQPQPLEGLRAGDLVHQVAIDVGDGRAVFLGMDDVRVPQLVVACVRWSWLDFGRVCDCRGFRVGDAVEHGGRTCGCRPDRVTRCGAGALTGVPKGSQR